MHKLLAPLAFSVMIVLLWPWAVSPLDLSSLDNHRASMAISPGLYTFASPGTLLPVRDIFSQYGTGQGFAGKLLFTDALQDFINRYQIFQTVLRLVFYWLFYLLLRKVYFTRSFALLTLMTVFFFTFSGTYGQTRLFWFPSVGPYRYFLTPLIALLLHRLFARDGAGYSYLTFAATSLAVALQFYWSTDVGLSVLAAIPAAAVISSWPQPRKMLRAIAHAGALLLGATFCYLVVCRVTYGPGFLSTLTLYKVVVYPMYYAFGGWSLESNQFSNDPLYMFINLICPGIAIFTFVSTMQSPQSDRKNSFVVSFLACVAILLHFKYVNRTFASYWFYDGFCFVFLCGYWLERLCQSSGRFIQRFAPAIVLTALLPVWWQITDKVPNPESYGLKVMLRCEYCAIPNLLNRLNADLFPINEITAQGSPDQYYTTKVERDAITSRIPPGQRAMVISSYEWAILLETKRAPVAYMLPTRDNVYLKRDVEHYMRQLESHQYIFDDMTDINAPKFAALYNNYLSQHFRVEEFAGRIRIWKRFETP